jgi:hypothetical protein
MEQKLNHYDIYEVLDTFNIETIQNCKVLDDWINASPCTLSPFEEVLIEELPVELQREERNWNEEELKMFFVSIVFRIANLYVEKKLKTFFERSLSGTVKDYKISVVVDCMVASPKKSGLPTHPYFFLQEYKRSKGDSHDPEGQMLAAMILAQELNNDGKPLYGCWLQGRIWYFTVLNGNEYCLSRAFDVTQKRDLLQVVYILRKLKEIILTASRSEV